MAESSFLCATSDGMLWSLGEGTPEGEWIADNIWQTKAETPKTPGINSESDSCMESWPEPRHLKARQGKKVSCGMPHGGRGLNLMRQPSRLLT